MKELKDKLVKLQQLTTTAIAACESNQTNIVSDIAYESMIDLVDEILVAVSGDRAMF